MLLGLFLIFNAHAAEPTGSVRPSVTLPSDYNLVWHDEFSGNSLDASKWKAIGGERDDAQRTAGAISVAKGLQITTFTQGQAPSTGFLSTQGLFAAKYGLFEAEIRFHDSPGEWCAFWLQSPTIGNPLSDPAAAGVEIDIAEHRMVNAQGVDISNNVNVALHWDGYGANLHSAVPAEEPVKNVTSGNSLQGSFHTYAVLWTADSYTFYLDGKSIWKYNQALSRRSEFIYLTCEVRNHSWAGEIPQSGYRSLPQSTTGMDVAWIRVWRRSE